MMCMKEHCCSLSPFPLFSSEPLLRPTATPILKAILQILIWIKSGTGLLSEVVVFSPSGGLQVVVQQPPFKDVPEVVFLLQAGGWTRGP